MDYQASCPAPQTATIFISEDQAEQEPAGRLDLAAAATRGDTHRDLRPATSKDCRPLPLPVAFVGARAFVGPSFVDLHHQQANQQQAGLPPNLFFTTAQRSLHAWRDGRPVLHPLTGDAALSLLPQLDHDRALRVLTAKPCHGLVLLYRWPWHGHYVCNPSTGALSPLPDSKMPFRMCDRYTLPNTVVNCVSYGLGYDPAAKEHKVVRVFYLDEGGSAAPVTACEIFSIGGSQACAHWRPAAQRAPICTMRPSTPAVFFSGRLHFLQREHGGCIITFDVHDETFGSLMPPSDSGPHNVTFQLTVLDGCLCLQYYGDDDVQDTSSLYIWRLISYDGAGQWEQLCCIRRQSWPEAMLHSDRISPLEIYRGGDGHRKIMFATCAPTVFAVDADVDGGGAPEILLPPPTGDAAMDSFIETNSAASRSMYTFTDSNSGSHSTMGLLEESLAPVGRASEEIVFSSPSTNAWSDVLKWLPARSVVPLSRVCKDWRAVIKSDRFMQLHAIHANMGKKSPKITLIDPFSGLFWTLTRQWRELHPRNTVGYLFCPRLGCRVVCSKPCHGLVVGSCTTQDTSFDFICNPTMGYYKQMVYLDPAGDATFLAGRIGLGYDSRTNKHVRVRLVYHERNMDTRNYQLGCYVHLTDTEATWRPISSPPRPVAEMQPVHVDGKLYWMVDPNLVGTKSSPDGCEMLALDVGTEEFEVLQGPRCSYDEITSIVELHGNLCVVCSDRDANALDIWMLEASGVWAIGCRVELGEFLHEYLSEETAPMAVDPTDGRLLLCTGRALGYYCPTARTVETIHRLVGQDAMKFSPLLSEESLICPYIRFEKATYSVDM
ncbi:hypothetical protein ACQ4PT_063860 [Festuca glaucescens]